MWLWWTLEPSAVPPTSHLPLVLMGMVLELDQPILLAVTHGTVVHGDDDGPSQQGAGGPAAHHRAQHCLAIVHWGPGGAQTNTHTHTHTHTHTLFNVDLTAVSHMGDMAALTADGAAPGQWCGRQHCIPHVVLPLHRHIHLVHSALRNGPCRNEQTNPWGAHKQTGTFKSCQVEQRSPLHISVQSTPVMTVMKMLVKSAKAQTRTLKPKGVTFRMYSR